ncbi:MAG TPA: acylneuraminate cytidylyltransferase family protein [Gammaproteobacteria bacterium]|nr:acylneuraminate cytidylyltransferase family protein [Gammaproteobacteria bacterium]
MKKNTILGLITARAGSKRLPGKNSKILGGKPLVQWTIDACKKSQHISDLVVSSDDQDLLNLCEKAGCQVPFIRPKNLATDYSTSFDVAEHAILNLKQRYDWLLLLQPTSPFRTHQDIDSAVEKAITSDCDSLVSISEISPSYYMNLTIGKDEKLSTVSKLPFKDLNNMRSQDMPKTYAINGAIYIIKIDFFLKKKIFFDDNSSYFLMSEKASVNIDTYHDWIIAESYLAQNHDKGYLE